jgi:transglutaminase-like putative cysteine protease
LKALKKILMISFIIITYVSSVPVYAEENELKIEAESLEELKQKAEDYVFLKLDENATEFSFVTESKVLNSYTYEQLLKEPTPFEAQMIDSYFKTSGKDYNALILRQYTISKTVWNNAINQSKPIKLLIYFKIVWGETRTEKTEVKRFADEKVRELIKEEYGNYERILALHRFMVNTYQYDMSQSEKIHEPYYLIQNKKGVCSAYSGLLHELLLAAGYESRIVLNSATAKSASGEEISHAWNLVKINDSWYHIDATWDDPVTPYHINSPNLNYFLKSDSLMAKDHSWSRTLYPEAPNDYKASLMDSFHIPAILPTFKNTTVADNKQKFKPTEKSFAFWSLSSLAIKNLASPIFTSFSDIGFWVYLIGILAFLYLIYAIATITRRRK